MGLEAELGAANFLAAYRQDLCPLPSTCFVLCVCGLSRPPVSTILNAKRLSAHAGHLMCVCVCMCARVHCLPLTMPPSASAAAPPPPLDTILGIDAGRTQCGVCAMLGGALCRKGGLTDWRQLIASMRVEVQHSAPPALPARATVTRNANPNRPGIKLHTRGAGRGTAQHMQAGDAVCLSAPFTKPRPPAGRTGTALSSHQYLI